MTDLIPACAATLEQIEAYLDGDLAAEGCRAIEAHAAQCAACAALVRGLRDTVGACRDAGRAPLPDAVRARAVQGVRRLLAEAAARGKTGGREE